jgi:hypothetical protein
MLTGERRDDPTATRPENVVERDVSGITMTHLCALLRTAEETSRSLSCDGRTIRHMRGIFLPGESRCLCLFEASSARLVREMNTRCQEESWPYCP